MRENWNGCESIAEQDTMRHRPAMIRHPLGLRLDSMRPLKDQIYEASRDGARGVVMDATGDLAPHRLGETGRRELRYLLRSVELSLVALHLPTRRPFDTTDQLDDRIRRGDAAFALAYELGTSLVLCRVGPVPAEEDKDRARFSRPRLGRWRSVPIIAAFAWPSRPERSPGSSCVVFSMPRARRAWPPASTQRACCAPGSTPCMPRASLGPWVAHAYAGDATGPGAPAAANPRGFGYPPGALDWEEYLGALEEVAYHGFLTVWPDPSTDPRVTYLAVLRRLEELS